MRGEEGTEDHHLVQRLGQRFIRTLWNTLWIPFADGGEYGLDASHGQIVGYDPAYEIPARARSTLVDDGDCADHIVVVDEELTAGAGKHRGEGDAKGDYPHQVQGRVGVLGAFWRLR